MTPRVDRRPEAVQDLEDLGYYLAEESPALSERFLVAAEATFEQLAEMPRMGRPRQFTHPDLHDLRSWAVKGFNNHLIFYRPIADGIEVIRVLHGARDLRRVFGEGE